MNGDGLVLLLGIAFVVALAGFLTAAYLDRPPRAPGRWPFRQVGKRTRHRRNTR